MIACRVRGLELEPSQGASFVQTVAPSADSAAEAEGRSDAP
jgi:hypothetical protein